MDYLDRIGVQALPYENSLQALRRYAVAEEWSEKTWKKHLNGVLKATSLSVESKLSDLDVMNSFLTELGRASAKTKAAARDRLSHVFINIFDFEAGILKSHKTIHDLKRYTYKSNLFYPRKLAKDYGYWVFLKKF